MLSQYFNRFYFKPQIRLSLIPLYKDCGTSQ
nr:MAG TPA: hypothetical protein [Caudoviricetes sp.]